MRDFIERLHEEREQLETKLIKLSSFISSKKIKEIDPFQRSLLNIQAKAMNIYLECLEERIKALVIKP